jgi:hypothetical protein
VEKCELTVKSEVDRRVKVESLTNVWVQKKHDVINFTVSNCTIYLETDPLLTAE